MPKLTRGVADEQRNAGRAAGDQRRLGVECNADRHSCRGDEDSEAVLDDGVQSGFGPSLDIARAYAFLTQRPASSCCQ